MTDGELLVYDLATGQPSRRWRGPGRPQDLAFRPDGAQIAVIYNETETLLPDSRSGDRPACPVDSVAQPRQIASPGAPTAPRWRRRADDRKIYLWDAATGIRRATLEGHTNVGLRAAFHPAGTLLASNGWEGRLRLWDPVLGRPWLSLTGDYACLNSARTDESSSRSRTN